MSTPAIAALTRLTAGWADPPRIVTVGRKPAAGLLPHVFGEAAVANLMLGEDGPAIIAPTGETLRFDTIAAAIETVRAGAGAGLILRFVDPATIRLVRAEAPEAIAAAAALWLSLRDADALAAAADALADAGFPHRLAMAAPPGLLLARAAVAPDPAPDRGAARTRARTLVLIDNNLTGERGHYLSIAQRISAGALQAGLDCIWGANQRLPAAAAPAGTTIDAVFATSIFGAPASAAADLSREIEAGWRALIERHDDPATHFLVPTTDGHAVRAIDRMLAGGLTPAGTIHLATPYETRHMAGRIPAPDSDGRELDWHLRRIAAHPLFGRQLFLWAETWALAALHRDRLGADVAALPLPAPAWGMEAPMPPATGPVRCVFLGEARLDKGALDLPDIAEALIAGAPPGTIAVTVQKMAPFGGFDAALDEAFARLAAMPGVELIEAPLDDAAYRRLMTGAHAVLLPYRPENYAARGSGILVEALASGRIVLAGAGTIAEDYAEDGIVLPCAGPADWTRAGATLAAERADLSRRAWRAGKRFCRAFAPRGHIDRLIARGELAAGGGIARP